jgi:hypothetical protein
MARPINAYCPHCGASRAVTREALKQRILDYVEGMPKVYTYEAEHAIFPEGPSAVGIHNMCMMLLELGWVHVYSRNEKPSKYWVPKKALAKLRNEQEIAVTTPEY